MSRQLRTLRACIILTRDLESDFQDPNVNSQPFIMSVLGVPAPPNKWNINIHGSQTLIHIKINNYLKKNLKYFKLG